MGFLCGYFAFFFSCLIRFLYRNTLDAFFCKVTSLWCPPRTAPSSPITTSTPCLPPRPRPPQPRPARTTPPPPPTATAPRRRCRREGAARRRSRPEYLSTITTTTTSTKRRQTPPPRRRPRLDRTSTHRHRHPRGGLPLRPVRWRRRRPPRPPPIRRSCSGGCLPSPWRTPPECSTRWDRSPSTTSSGAPLR